MRLALKLLSSLAVLTVLMLGASAYVEERRQGELLQMDIDAEKRMAGALHAVVIRVCELNGPSTAREIIETLNEKTPRNIRWLEPGQVPQVPGKDLPGEVASKMESGEPTWAYWPDPNGESIRYIYIPVAHGGKPLAVIEASQSMEPRKQYVAQEHVRTAAVGFLVLAVSGALAALLGRRLVGKPMAALTHGMRRLGEGHTDHVAPPRLVERRDEFGALALELNALGDRLAERERMRHDDRLRTVGQLASGVAHELGTPLSVVAVRAKLIASGEAAGDEAVSNAKAILEQSERMTRLVRQLLDYSRRGGNGTTTTVDLRQAMLQSVEMLEPLARTYGVSVVAAGDEGDLHVHGDAAQLQQVLTNLVLNAIQAMPTGGTVEVRCGRDRGRGARAADQCWVRVTDEGPGVPPNDLEHVFEPFFTTKAVGEGTGLGLAVVQAIVEEHGGSIAVENQPTHGAVFTVYLPPIAAAAARLAS
jgi:two-component system NtrC family sensor kinase